MPDVAEREFHDLPGPGGRFITGRRIVVAWAIFGCISSLQTALSSSIHGYPIPLWMGFALQMPQIVVWAALTPLILWLGRRFPLRGAGWPARLLLHIAAGGFCVLLEQLAFEIYLPWFPWPQPVPFMTRTLQQFGLWAVADSLLYWVVLAIGHVEQEARRVVAKERQRSMLMSQLSRARLDALTIRLQPHFLFNTLHAISSLVLEKPREANRMIARLSELLRLTLHRTRSPFVPLHQELELLEHYIALQEMRFGDRLQISMTVDADTPMVDVPALLLQPIVENAVRYADCSPAGAPRVDILVRRTSDRLRLEVRDNGPGFPVVGSVIQEGEGLRNTRARLQEAYGDRQVFSLGSNAVGGATVIIEIPAHEALEPA